MVKAKQPKKQSRKLHKIKCANCLYEFTVANPDSWVCPSCYSRKVAGLPGTPAVYAEKKAKKK